MPVMRKKSQKKSRIGNKKSQKKSRIGNKKKNRTTINKIDKILIVLILMEIIS
jgi:hypothetical protein